MTNFPKIFCITLKDTPERKKIADKHFKDNGLYVEFFEGINGKKFGLKTSIPYNDDSIEKSDYYILHGKIGCLLSHYMLWQTLLYLPYDEIIILEDDAYLCDNFIEKFFLYKNQLPSNWEYVFLGYSCFNEFNLPSNINDKIIKCKIPPLGTFGYMIKKSAIPILLDTNHQAWAPVDIQIQKKSLENLNHYICSPPLINHRLHYLNDKSKIFDSLTEDKIYQ